MGFTPISCVKDNDTKRVLLLGPIDKELYNPVTENASILSEIHPTMTTFLASSSVWYDRLCHVADSVFKKVLANNSIDVIKFPKVSVCESCTVSTSHKQPFPKHSHVAVSASFELLYIAGTYTNSVSE